MNHFDKVFLCFPQQIQEQIRNLDLWSRNNIEEIRVYKGKAVQLYTAGRRISLKGRIEGHDMTNLLNHLMKFSYHSYEEDLAKGFITIDGGHRVGVCGKAVLNNGKVSLLRDVSSLNIRCAKEVVGCSDTMMHLILGDNQLVKNTLIVSPPGCGKTTLLRDIARNLSLKGYKISICDERSEIAGMHDGKSSYQLGDTVDVLDGCPKGEGMIMMIRAMSPQVLITDEIGKQEDIFAIKTCINCGVSIITSIHGNDMNDLKISSIHPLIESKVFHNIVFLSDRPKAGTVREVLHV